MEGMIGEGERYNNIFVNTIYYLSFVVGGAFR